MVWNAFMRGTRVDPLAELERFITTAFPGTANEYPAIDLWVGDEGVRLHAQLPGLAASDIDLSVVGDTVTLKGVRPSAEPGTPDAFHRRERESGRFVRTIQLPFPVESDAVRARFRNGMLEVELPRAASDKPKKITVQSV